MSSNVWYPVGGSGGLPSDMLTNQKICERRLKVSTVSATWKDDK